MKIGAFALAAVMALCVATANAASAPDVDNTSFAASDGTRTLQQSIVIAAPVAALWKGFTDATEFRKWAAPVAAIDLRVGGSLEASYKVNAKIGDPDNIRHRIITYLPERLIVFQNIQARNFPDRAFYQQTVSILQFEPLSSGETKVTLSSTGYRSGDAFARVYRFFERDNAEALEAYKHTYEVPQQPPASR
jgi:uncharacterized protein YndB with AHSA1/START domain